MPIKLYYHKTDGGAEYLMDKYSVCPNGSKEGIIEGADYIIRLDGEPELLKTPSAAAALGRKGGSAKSERKTAACRENGKRGGRPKKG